MALEAPPPWLLRGRGYALVYRWPPRCRRRGPAGRQIGGLAVLLLLSYRSSPVGPYREAILASGPRPDTPASGLRRRWTVERIWVTTAASAAHGRRNWGLPKEEAAVDFAAGSRQAGGTEGKVPRAAPARLEKVTVRLPAGARHPDAPLILEAVLRPKGPQLPVPSCLTLRLLQSLHGRLYRTDIAGGGRVRLARLERLVVGSRHLPVFLSRARPLLALALEELRVVFPAARVSARNGRRR